MTRVVTVLATGSYDPERVGDSVVLDRTQRGLSRTAVTTTNGMGIEIAFSTPTTLRSGDALVLEDGRLIDVVTEAEPLFEIRLADLGQLARLAWQLGDRHIPVQVLPKRVRVARDAAVEETIRKFGFEPRPIEAPFEPEGGAYHVSTASHHHDHGSHCHQHDAHAFPE